MKYKNLGRTGLKVSSLCLGTMNFGKFTTEEESFKIMDNALEMGINFFDTANCYGKKMLEDRKFGDGQTERILGNWFAKGNNRREKIILATKVYVPMGSGPNDRGLSAYNIRRSCEDSLRRLQTDHIDLYQMHHIDRSAPWEEVWQAMEQLVREGKVIYIGSSNFAAWNIVQAQCMASSRNFMGIVSEQSLYNLCDRMIELEVVPACREYGIGIIPWSPLKEGLLGGILQKEDKKRSSVDSVNKLIEKYHTQLLSYESFCRELGEKPAIVALAWLLNNPVVTAPIIGPRTMEHLTGSLESLELEFSEDSLAKLNSIWPGPGGEAPEAYAW
jgi:aryl-alcohol dehydrogenase-like predicted oxidoreductase